MERPAEMGPRVPGEVLMEHKAARTYLGRADFEQWGLIEGCPGCRYPFTGNLCSQFFLFWGLINLCSYSFGVGRFFHAVKRLQYLTLVDFFLKIFMFLRARFIKTLFIKKGTFNHCGRSKAWNSTHHATYVFHAAFVREK